MAVLPERVGVVARVVKAEAAEVVVATSAVNTAVFVDIGLFFPLKGVTGGSSGVQAT